MTRPLCRYCGEPIAKATKTVWLRTKADIAKYPDVSMHGVLAVDALPQTINDCRKLTNRQVVSVTRFHRGEKGSPIDAFSTWDGESYEDQYFCKGAHAKAFGYAAARSGQATQAYNKAVAVIGEKAA